ncbi:hypothetical protein QJS04_geneDACA018718 [Acorus gramineus]|uniref:Wall-associated receptor kinase galacturonan-binding domain-containing protein n=1 Tax=Acorus gramineus TaxID=55184 RepID=A0AAV9A3J8_ACOGR|nr:hypothetical protein QJS04_geneDACA018718 [Acorus gramineus]
MALLSISTTLIFFISITHSAHANQPTQLCPTQPSCGSATFLIRYPFWLTTTTTYCGYPGFGLHCRNPNDPPILPLPNADYFVTAIDYAAHVVILANIDAFNNKTCPHPRHNFTLDDETQLFNYTQYDQKLTFLFNCTNPFFDGFKQSPLFCMPNSFVITGDLDFFSEVSDWYLFCEDGVEVPAIRHYVSEFSMDFGEVLSRGFELGWRSPAAMDCEGCERSGDSME